MRCNVVIFWSSVFGLALAAPAQEPAPVSPAGASATQVRRLSRPEAVQEALEHNPALAAAREQVEEARAGISIATAWADPSLVTESDQLTSFFKPHSASEHDLGLQFTVPFPNRTRLNGKVARASWQQMQFALRQLQQQTSAQTVQAYDAILVALRHHEDLQQSQEMSRQFLEKTEAR